jgi:hypothetical protein
MKKILTLIVLIKLSSSLLAQQRPAGNFTYYVEITNATTKKQLADVTTVVQSKTGVTFFNFYRGGNTFFILISTQPVADAVLNTWLQPLGMHVAKIEQHEITDAFMKAKRRGTGNESKNLRRKKY